MGGWVAVAAAVALVAVLAGRLWPQYRRAAGRLGNKTVGRRQGGEARVSGVEASS